MGRRFDYIQRKERLPKVAFLDIAGRKLAWVTDTKWEASSGDFSPDGRRLTYTINADGRVDTYVADVATTRLERKSPWLEA